jgi:hypothetical protein
MKDLRCLKGLDPHDEYFFKACYIKSILSVLAQTVFKVLGCLVKEKSSYKVSVCFFENTF